MSKYQAVLMAPDGDYVTDYSADTVEDVWQGMSDGGSRWYFYPLGVVVEAGPVTYETLIVGAGDFHAPDVLVIGSDYEGRPLGDLMEAFRAEVARAERLISCPACHGAGKVDPQEVEA